MTTRPILSLLLFLILLLWLDLFISRAFLQGAFLHYNPVNGDFQTYNPLRRMSEAGEMPGRDFQPYLGIGTTYATYLPYLLLGQDFSASKTASYMAHSLLFFLSNFILLQLLGTRKAISFCGSVLLFLYAYVTSDFLFALPFHMAMSESALPFGQTFRALSAPENSCLGIRVALPFLTAGLLMLCYRSPRMKDARTEAIVWGIVTGLQVAWSNDYGFISAAMLVVVYNMFIARGTWVERIACGTTHIVAAIAGAVFIVAIATGGYGMRWLHYNFGGVAKDQFWYFMLSDEGKVFDLAIFLKEKRNLFFLTFLSLVAGGIGIQQLCAKHKNLRLILLGYILATTVAAGLVSSIGGGFMWRYFSAAVRLSPFIAVWLGWLLVRRLPLSIFYEQATLLLAVATLVAGVGFHLYFDPITLPAYRSYVEGRAEGRFFYDEKAGGYLPNSQKLEVEFANALVKHHGNLPPEQRVFSTYSTLIEAESDSLQASKIDYIIHALGKENRAEYLHAFEAWKPLFVTTPRENYTLWETWSRRVNWWFYREMLTHYRPAFSTPYHVIWQRQEAPLPPADAAHFTCAVEKISEQEVRLIISDKDIIATGNTLYVELAVTHAAKVEPSGVPYIGERGLIVVNEHKSRLDEYEGYGIGSMDSRSYNAPIDASPLLLAVEHNPGSVSELILRAAPSDRAVMGDVECMATGALPKPVEPEPATEIPAGLFPSPQ